MVALISPLQLKKLAENWLAEDLPSFDVGGFVVNDNNLPYMANLYCKQPCVLSGVPFFDAIFSVLDCSVEWMVPEGSEIVKVPSIIAKVRGPARQILLGERPALNCLSRASGVTTQTRRLVNLCKSANQWQGRLAATRKTTPGFRLVEKYSVLVGGGDSHRYDLSSMVMLKDNHVTACNGNIGQAIQKARSVAGFSQKIEVEARNGTEALEAAKNGADVVMLDNFRPEDASKTAKQLKIQYPNIVIEISGGIDEKNIINYCIESVDVISLGLLTQGYPCIDFSLKLAE